MSSLAEPRRPRLVAQNRKLRHLRGIWLRNLSFAPTSLRTADDADLATSTNKLPVLRETGQLHPSRSSESLRKDSVRHDALRPQQKRRTSLSLAHVNPVARQKNLEMLFEGSVGDVFYSLHVDGDAEPVYISEVRERATVRRASIGQQITNLTVPRASTLNSSAWKTVPRLFQDAIPCSFESGHDDRKPRRGLFSSTNQSICDASTL